ncbi:hypothetical protein NDU88_009011 [Pleurodeles waltl]|uniref:Reverse transcriptase zinc-binding domain-containing protein n=1 Tax=Pleurodeles waltl TaxID=8319 RepID=A0AAV7QW85_PLEWA|nr:hypothetical protein NDU88_009011 [Pleurodeles waltl]
MQGLWDLSKAGADILMRLAKKNKIFVRRSFKLVKQLDLEADKTSSEFESEVSSLALGKELHKSSGNATVRKKQRKRSEQVGPNKHSINPLDTKGLQGLQWEYSKDDLTLYDNGEKQPNPVSLETIYQSIMEHREESKLESRRYQMACRKMQIQIRRVAKTCSEFTTRMEEAESRISRLEDEAGSHQSSREAMKKQLEDTQWKLTDLEDRMRRNNLRVLVAAAYQSHRFECYEYGESTGKVLARRVRQKAVKQNVLNIIDGNGRNHTELEGILEVLKGYYQDLYREDIMYSEQLQKESQKYGRVQLSEIPVVEAVKNGAKIGKLYKLLTELQVDDMVQQNERWIVRFGVAGEWVDQSLAMADTTFLSANLKTQHYKTLMDLYYTPAKLKKWGTSSGSCNRCGGVGAEITHMFFACPMLQGILNEIEVFLKKITHCNIQVTVMLVVLRVVDSPESMEPVLYKIR